MEIGIVGLGLIGGSLAKAIKAHTDHKVFGFNRSQGAIRQAIADNALNGELTDDKLNDLDLIIVCLYPADTIEYVKSHASLIAPETVVIDCSGVKRMVCEALEPVAHRQGFTFLGAHPMAGTERSGYMASRADLFKGASMIITPNGSTPKKALDLIEELCMSIGFAKLQHTTPQEHDLMIAYTSQLAHVVSSAYVDSPNALKSPGFTAGSFKDMTRVARLNVAMWTELFISNSDCLADETDALILRLSALSKAIREHDAQTLSKLLSGAKALKELVDSNNTIGSM